MKRIALPRSMIFLGTLVAFVASLPLAAIAWTYCDERVLLELSTAWAVMVILLGGVYSFSVVDGAFERIRRLARSVREGDLKARLYPNRSPQLTPLYNELNQMANALDDRMRSLSSVAEEQETILGSMIEGVLVVDQKGHVRMINRTALNYLDITTLNAAGQPYSDVIKDNRVCSFIEAALTQSKLEPVTITVSGRVERILELRSAPLLARDQVAPGVLFVFYDVTRIHQLEAVRRDFVANVSHELRTPVTSIKGFVETLIDGAKDEPDSLDRFLAIIARQAERLNSIFNDLLTLARLEAGGDGAKIDLETRGIRDLVQAAVDDCSHRGEAKGMRLEVLIDSDVKVKVNSSLIQQALVNLIDNAIKYSDSNRLVRVESRNESGFVRIIVVDQGPGIESAHLARVFERFYRIDQGRSRQLGGTGLGLAIVKHIAHVHGGDVSVESEVGKGSRFSISLPAEDYPLPSLVLWEIVRE